VDCCPDYVHTRALFSRDVDVINCAADAAGAYVHVGRLYRAFLMWMSGPESMLHVILRQRDSSDSNCSAVHCNTLQHAATMLHPRLRHRDFPDSSLSRLITLIPCPPLLPRNSSTADDMSDMSQTANLKGTGRSR